MSEAEKLCLKNFLDYGFTLPEQENFTKIVRPIISHPEFEKRCTDNFPHHGNTTLGEHILKDAMITYRLANIYKSKHPNVDISTETAVVIALFHDLYTNPWQNVDNDNPLYEKHGFMHPIEAVINAYEWYPEYFKDKEVSKKIIDGVLHHMYPFPVRKINDEIEINEKKITNFKFYDVLVHSTKSKRENLCFKKATFIEGKLVSKADKLVTVKEIKNISSLVALVTAKNKSIIKY